MSITTHDLAVGIAALIAFPLAINLTAALASDASPHPRLPQLEHREDDPVEPARFTAHLTR